MSASAAKDEGGATGGGATGSVGHTGGWVGHLNLASLHRRCPGYRCDGMHGEASIG